MELQRNLNNCFAYDLVPSPSVVIAALRAARRVNDFPSAVRVFEGTLPLGPCIFLSLAPLHTLHTLQALINGPAVNDAWWGNLRDTR
jgi:hypothetical protein